MGNVIESFLVALGFQTDTKGLEQLKVEAEGAKAALLGIVGIATGAAVAIGLLVEKVAGGMAEMNDFAEINNVSAAAVDTLGKAAFQNNSSLEAVKSSISGINRVIGEAALGIGRGAMTFEKLGLSAKDAAGHVKSADTMLDEVAEKIKNKSRQEQIATLEKLGVDRSMIMMMKDGAESFQQIKAEAMGNALFTDKDYERADEINKLFMKVKASIGGFTKQIAVGLFPVVQQALKGYLDWFKASKKATSDTFLMAIKALAAAIATLWDWVVRLVSALLKAVKWLKQFEVVTYLAYTALAIFISLQAYSFLMSLEAALAKGAIALMRFAASATAASVSAFLIPIAIGAIFIALVALVDELMNFKEGNDSFLGDLVKEYPQLLAVINGASDAISAIWGYLVSLYEQLQPAIMELATSIGKLMVELWPVLKFLGMVAVMILSVALPIILSFVTGFVKMIAWGVETVVAILSAIIRVIAWIVDVGASLIGYLVNFFVKLFTEGANAVSAIFMIWGEIIRAVFEGLAAVVEFFFGLIDLSAARIQEVLIGAFTAVRDWVVGIFDSMIQNVEAFIGKIGTALSWISKLVGASADAGDAVGKAVTRSVGAKGVAVGADGSPGSDAGSPSAFQPTGGIGVAAGPLNAPGNVSTNTTTVNAPITVNAPDAAAAGKSVKEELDRVNRDATRNGQSAVAL